MCERINNYLEQLIDKPINSIGRASNMLWIGIGKINVQNKSEVSLHVQSMWRIVNKEKNEIVLASSDFYSPRSSDEYSCDFDWDVQGKNLFDEKSKLWLQNVDAIYIRKYKISRWGDLLIVFSNGECLEIFVDSSDDTEAWRVFRTDSEEEHLVATGLGVSFE